MQDGLKNPHQFFGVTEEQANAEKAKEMNCHFFRIYEFLETEFPASESKKIAKNCLVDAFNEYRRLVEKHRQLKTARFPSPTSVGF